MVEQVSGGVIYIEKNGVKLGSEHSGIKSACGVGSQTEKIRVDKMAKGILRKFLSQWNQSALMPSDDGFHGFDDEE